MFQDLLGRRIGYLRLSLTKSCQLRCTYCRPRFLTNDAYETRLSPRELEAVVWHLAGSHQLRKVRLTGGDPTARADLISIIERISEVPGVEDLAMTTHGLTLARSARRYADAGLHRVNISLDSLHPETFRVLTGVDAHRQVLAGIDAAIAANLSPIKINTVVLRDANLAELPELVEFALRRGCEIRFIELMPMGPLAASWDDRFVSAATMRTILQPYIVSWQDLPQGSDSATRYRICTTTGAEGVIGFITPMSCHFCKACSRIRIDAEGLLYPCLMDHPAESLLPAIRPDFDPERFDRLLASSLLEKKSSHPHDGFVAMTHIGG